ncbi:MAG: 50S ribosomal protein L4 [Bacilli bacterium]
MEKVKLLNLKGEKLKDIKLNETVFGITPNDKVVYDAIILTRASLRQGTHKTKNRSEVSGGGKKPWAQKGTGHARQGSIRAVQWVGGGRYGTPVPRDYSIKMNRKERRLAIKSALASAMNEGKFIVLDEFKLTTPKTKEMINALEALNIASKKDLIVLNELDENTILAARNIQNIMVIEADEINVLDVVNADYIVITEAALHEIEEVLA